VFDVNSTQLLPTHRRLAAPVSFSFDDPRSGDYASGMLSLPRDPRAMLDDELAAWVRDVINRRTPESEMLDYKHTVDVDGRRARLELAKDASSFANDRGGVLLYGVPEDDSGPAPVPLALDQCGISLAPNLAETVENILVETVDPPLPVL